MYIQVTKRKKSRSFAGNFIIDKSRFKTKRVFEGPLSKGGKPNPPKYSQREPGHGSVEQENVDTKKVVEDARIGKEGAGNNFDGARKVDRGEGVERSVTNGKGEEDTETRQLAGKDRSSEKIPEEGPIVRVSFSRVVDENGSHMEIAGVAPALNQGPTTVQDLADLAAFCESICTMHGG